MEHRSLIPFTYPRSVTTLLVLVAASALTFGCSDTDAGTPTQADQNRGSEQAEHIVVATVNTTPISLADYNTYRLQFLNPSTGTLDTKAAVVVDSLINQALAYQYAQEHDLLPSPANIDQAVEAFSAIKEQYPAPPRQEMTSQEHRANIASFVTMSRVQSEVLGLASSTDSDSHPVLSAENDLKWIEWLRAERSRADVTVYPEHLPDP